MNKIFFVVLLFSLMSLCNAQRSIKLSEFGAKSDGKFNNSEILKNAIKYCTEVNGILNISDENYYVNSKTPIEITCSINGNGSIINEGDYLVLKKDNINISNITVTGGTKSTGKGLYVYGNNIVVHDITIKNIWQGGISAEGVNNLTIDNVTIDNCKGIWGDGILLLRCKNSVIRNSKISNVSRVGIGSDTNADNFFCENISIINNSVRNALHAAKGQLNGGIWVENTHGAIVNGNIISNTNDRGLVIAPVIKSNHIFKYEVQNNRISNSKYLLAISGELSNADFYINGNQFSGNFERGIDSGGNFGNMIIENCIFDTRKNEIKKYRLIYIDMYGGWRKSNLILKKLKKERLNKQGEVFDISVFNGRFLNNVPSFSGWKIEYKK